jgi:negative regulator of sigma-B (phosphoserine phosphatase)
MRLGAWIEWHAQVRPFPGETVSGDAWCAAPQAGGLLVAVIDGLGHGPAAAAAANRARDVLCGSSGTGLEVLLGQCHAALRGTRGAALTLALIPPRGRLTWLGVGNVEAVIARAGDDGARESLLLRPGVVGYQMPGLRAAEVDFGPGDTLVMATDGVRSSFIEALSGRDRPARRAQRILDEYGKQTDDALVLVAARLRGGP